MITDMTDTTSIVENMPSATLSVRANHALNANGLPVDAKALGMTHEEALVPVLTLGGKTGFELACLLDACKMAYGSAENCPVHADDELPLSALKELTAGDVKELRSLLGDRLTPKSIMSLKYKDFCRKSDTAARVLALRAACRNGEAWKAVDELIALPPESFGTFNDYFMSVWNLLADICDSQFSKAIKLAQTILTERLGIIAGENGINLRTLEDVAPEFGLTHERVRQLEASAKAILNSPWGRQALKCIVDICLGIFHEANGFISKTHLARNFDRILGWKSTSAEAIVNFLRVMGLPVKCNRTDVVALWTPEEEKSYMAFVEFFTAEARKSYEWTWEYYSMQGVSSKKYNFYIDELLLNSNGKDAEGKKTRWRRFLVEQRNDGCDNYVVLEEIVESLLQEAGPEGMTEKEILTRARATHPDYKWNGLHSLLTRNKNFIVYTRGRRGKGTTLYTLATLFKNKNVMEILNKTAEQINTYLVEHDMAIVNIKKFWDDVRKSMDMDIPFNCFCALLKCFCSDSICVYYGSAYRLDSNISRRKSTDYRRSMEALKYFAKQGRATVPIKEFRDFCENILCMDSFLADVKVYSKKGYFQRDENGDVVILSMNPRKIQKAG